MSSKSVTKKKPRFSSEELARASQIQSEELQRSVNPATMFSTGVYCILHVAERNSNARFVHGQLMKHGFGDPEYLNRHLTELRRRTEGIRWPNKKFSYLKEFSLWWGGTELPAKIIDDINDRRNGEFALRDELAQSAPGIGYKSASLFMLRLGYQNVVPVDVWECRFLKDMGYNVRIGDYKTISGPKDRQYLEYESKIRALARRDGLTPAFFHFALWGREHDR